MKSEILKDVLAVIALMAVVILACNLLAFIACGYSFETCI